MLLKHIENILRRFDIEPKPMDHIIDSYYRTHRSLGPKERRFVSDTVFGIMRWKRRIEGALYLAGIKKPSFLQIVSAYLLWRGGKSLVSNETLLLSISDLRLNFETPVSKFPGGPSAYWSFPQFIYDKLVQWKGIEWTEKILPALNEEAGPVIRTNILKISRNELQKALKAEGVDSTPTKYSPFGLVLKERTNLNSLALFKEGMFEVQEEASQLVGLIVNPGHNELVIDCCAGAGGKTLLLAMLMGNKGRVIASDFDDSKLKILKRRARQAGITNIEVLTADKLTKQYAGKADALLLDAPCSGTGTLRRNPDIKWRITEVDVADNVVLQRKLLTDYSSLIKKGGRLIYATCSILPQENEEVAEWFSLKSGWKTLSVRGLLEIPNEEIFVTRQGYFRTDPGSVSMDGFFASVMQRI
jgi:16S rRNA (cytosine967-C5)-methyltransferase